MHRTYLFHCLLNRLVAVAERWDGRIYRYSSLAPKLTARVIRSKIDNESIHPSHGNAPDLGLDKSPKPRSGQKYDINGDPKNGLEGQCMRYLSGLRSTVSWLVKLEVLPRSLSRGSH